MGWGVLATPVKPLHPRHPLNIFARDALWDEPPAVPLYASMRWNPYHFFQDIPFYDPASKSLTTEGAQLRAAFAETGVKILPYLNPYTLTSEYPEANHYRREWEILPARHAPGYFERPVTADRKEKWTECWMSPASETYRRFFAYRVGRSIREYGLRGLYFDFATAYRDSNKYHGAHGGYCILGMRDFYRRLVNEFVKAGNEDYVIVAHNSQAVQIPALSFVTHFYNGEHLRTSSSPTLHEGRDYLDTLPLYYFGIEQSGLPWGIHGNMLCEFDEGDHLLERIGVTDETVAEYLWNRTPSIVMPILLHGSLPDGYRLSMPYLKPVVALLHQFDVPSATFHPYWRNAELVQVDDDRFKVSAWSRPESPRLLLVVGNLAKEDGEATITVNLNSLYDWNQFTLPGMKRVRKRGDLMQMVERVGARDARILGISGKKIKLWVRGHAMALVEATGHMRIR